MSVATSNAFALLDDEGTMDVSALAARLPAAPKPVAKPAEETKPVAASRPGARDAPRGGRGGPGGRGPRGPPRGDEASFAETAPAVRAGRGAGAPRGGPRGPRRSAEGERPGRRTYDRHDGTGRGHEVEKRRGTGRGNWGSEVDPAAAEGAPAAEPAAEVEPVEPTEEEIAAAEAARLEREAEEKMMSLADFEAALAAKKEGLNRSGGSAFVPSTEQFAGMTTMPKPAEDRTLELTKNAKVHGVNKGGRDKELKQKEVVLDVGFKIASGEEPRRSSRPEGGRGGRGGRFEGGRGGRGGRFEGGRGAGRFEGGRGAGRFEGGRGPAPPKAAGPAINVDDTSAFPSLS